ncbi:hypothetical protein Tcan_12024 [Toxocara canis]|uniref:Chondroitin proteoglycan 4 domain-containing protein n=1 Tax=Toxocara canis TaxID=6265 RepID=A0A0B2UQG0_TOXCA|nr:hypothetical protein Tcan_12024 [Toxocara canis]
MWKEFDSDSVAAQIPQQPAVTTSSACLNGCFQDGSLVFVASDLRNFEKISINIEQFCNVYEQLMTCTASCSEADRDQLARRVALSEYICRDKIEEFRLVKECLQSQGTETVNQCASDCGHPADATVQLDSSPSAAVNPFAFFDSISPVCRTLECIVKCSIAESNKKCAGSGDIFRDIGFKQVLDASGRLRSDLDNSSSSVAGQLAKIYLEALPEQCAYIVDPMKYDMLFAVHEEDLGSEVVTETASNEEFNAPTTSPSITQSDDAVWVVPDSMSTRIFEFHIEGSSTERSSSSGEFPVKQMTTRSPSETSTNTAFVFEPVNEPDIPIGPPSLEPVKEESLHEIDAAAVQPEIPVQIQIQPVPNQPNVEHIVQLDEPTESMPSSMVPQFDEQPSPTSSATPLGITEAAVTESATTDSATEESEMSESMPTEETHETVTGTGTNEAERTIMVVNDESEIANNEVRDEHHQPQQQKKNGATNSTPVWFAFIAFALLFAF